MSKDEYQFDNIESLMRDREIEGKIGAELGLPGGITLTVLAASDANSRWRMRGEEILAESNRLRNARATPERQRHYWSRIFAECLVIGWSGVKSGGADLPFSVEACTAFLRKADDAYTAIENVVFENRNFRGQRLKAVVDEGKA